jgi:hypothetical protein
MAQIEGRPVLLVGSVPLASAQNVFSSVTEELGQRVRRMPDGETGVRKDWILWQGARLRSGTGVVVQGERVLPGGTIRPILAIDPSVSAQQVTFGPLGYAEEAVRSYQIFRDMRARGEIPHGIRMQVSLPTPIAVVQGFFAAVEDVRKAWPAYEKQMLAELAEIFRGIPNHDLAIQWDVCAEFIRILEIPDVAKDYTFEELVDGIARVSAATPPAVELGYHLCYGDIGHKHVVEPRDMRLLVEMANRIVAVVPRLITWFHMPVPRERSDAAYFAPLANLNTSENTELYLGLVHMTDGLAGAQRRLSAAKNALRDFGVATECGFGRRSPDTIPQLLRLHRQVAELN